MTHDPLCRYKPERRTKCTHGMDADGYFSIESITSDVCQTVHYWPGIPCTCDLIAEIQAHERERIADAVAQRMLTHPHEYPSDYAEVDREWIKAGCPDMEQP